MLSALLSVLLTADPTVSILTLGTHHAREVKKPGQGWLGLFSDRLAPVTLTTKRVRDPIDDENEPESVMSGLELSNAGEPALLFIKGLVARQVSPAPFERGRTLGDGKPLQVGDATLTAAGAGGAHQLVLTRGEQRQVLYQHAEGDTDGWGLRWAGDLDGDGKLDLILTADDHYNLTTTRLFLSSQAKKGELVHQAAKFTSTGC